MLWLVAGAALGWMGIEFVGMNKDCGTIVSIVIGAIGAVIGGKLVAPMSVPFQIRVAIRPWRA